MYSISKDMENRINILRVILIILVVLIHADTDNISNISLNLPSWFVFIKVLLSQVVARIAVPLFFLISAILLFAKIDKYTYKNNLTKKVRKLIIPYIFWNLLWIIIFAIGQELVITNEFFSNPDRTIANFTLKQWLNSFGLIEYNGSSSPFLYPFWFIRDLIILNIIYPLIKWAIDRSGYFFIGLLILMYLFSINIGVLSSEALLFFSVGYIAVKQKITFEEIDKLSYLLVIFIYLFTLILVFIYDINVILLKVNVMCGVLLMIKLSNNLSRKRYISEEILKISSYSFFIYATHEWTITFLRKLCLRIVGIDVHSIIFCYFGLTITIIAGAIIVGKIINNIMPKFYAVITGGR